MVCLPKFNTLEPDTKCIWVIFYIWFFFFFFQSWLTSFGNWQFQGCIGRSTTSPSITQNLLTCFLLFSVWTLPLPAPCLWPQDGCFSHITLVTFRIGGKHGGKCVHFTQAWPFYKGERLLYKFPGEYPLLFHKQMTVITKKKKKKKDLLSWNQDLFPTDWKYFSIPLVGKWVADSLQVWQEHNTNPR